jgi:hypothetical protein
MTWQILNFRKIVLQVLASYKVGQLLVFQDEHLFYVNAIGLQIHFSIPKNVNRRHNMFYTRIYSESSCECNKQIKIVLANFINFFEKIILEAFGCFQTQKEVNCR